MCLLAEMRLVMLLSKELSAMFATLSRQLYITLVKYRVIRASSTWRIVTLFLHVNYQQVFINIA